MSFILDALRKSDARRKQTDAPGLNSPEPSRPPRRRHRRLLPIIAILALVAVVAAASVYVMRPDWLSQRLADNEAAPASDATSGQRGPESATETVAGNENESGESAGADPAVAGPGEATQPGSPSESAVAQSSDDSEPPESEDASEPEPIDRRQANTPGVERTVRRTTRQRESAPVRSDSEAATRELERRMAEQQAQQRRQSSQPSDDAPPRTAQNRPDEDDAVPGNRRRQPPAHLENSRPDKPKPLNEGVAEYVHAWELPLSVRRNLPELELSIHVFSPKASERFVLINGERYTKGDTINEVEIVDIRREGAIVDYQSHRFLLEPR